MDLKVKGLSGKRRVIIETDRIGDWENAEVSYFISNATELRDNTVIHYYHRRNWIEVFYREVKDFLGADEYQVRSIDRILRHWTLCIVTYSMMQWLQHGKAIKEFEKKKRLTFGDVQTVCRIYLEKRIIELATLDPTIFLKHLDGILVAP